ncbi:MAG: Ig domain-containing protein [Thaumarchaeota archaeon]|nr:Ig domain-containing protein [Nitrososphaerota archaeon]
MRLMLGMLVMLSLVVLLAVPVHADINSVKVSKEHFGIKDKFTISGTVNDSDRVMLLASIKGPGGEKLTVTAISDHDTQTFTFASVNADELFKTSGVYIATIFTENQRPKDGFEIELEYVNSKITVLPDYVLELNKVGNKTATIGQKLSFEVTLTDSTVYGEKFSLEKSPPAGATISPDAGRFSWTPRLNQMGSHVFDLVVNAGPLEDRETIQIMVYQPSKTKDTFETTDVKYNAGDGLKIPAPFVDSAKDMQYYIDRYNNEPAYKEWFDANYPEYSSIYQAVGLDEPPKIPAPFVDSAKDMQYYIDRYNNEPAYKEWFDANYPEYTSIYQAVGLEEFVEKPAKEPVKEPPEQKKDHGYCGDGTKLVNDICEIASTSKQKPWWQFW